MNFPNGMGDEEICPGLKQKQFNHFVRDVMHAGTGWVDGRYVLPEVEFAWTVWKTALAS